MSIQRLFTHSATRALALPDVRIRLCGLRDSRGENFTSKPRVHRVSDLVQSPGKSLTGIINGRQPVQLFASNNPRDPAFTNLFNRIRSKSGIKCERKDLQHFVCREVKLMVAQRKRDRWRETVVGEGKEEVTPPCSALQNH